MKCPQCGYENLADALCCNLCQNVLRREVKKDAAPPPSVKIDYAGVAAGLASRGDALMGAFGLRYDYTPASLAAIDAFITSTYGEAGESPQSDDYTPSKGKTIMIMEWGCYFGEVVRRELPGAWQEDPEHPGQPLWTRLVLEGGLHFFPIARVFKRFKNGKEDDLMTLLLRLMAEGKKTDLSGWYRSFINQAERFLDSSLPERRKLTLASDFYLMAATLDPSKKESAQRRSELLLMGLETLDKSPAPEPEPPAAVEPEPAPAPAPERLAADRARQARGKYDKGLAEDLLNNYDSAARALAGFLRQAQPGQEKEVEDAQRRLPALQAFAAAFDPKHSLEVFVGEVKKALALYPGRVDARRELAVALCLLQRYDESLASFDVILAAHPDHELTLQNKGAALSKMGRLAEAAAHFGVMLAKTPGDRGLWRNKADCLEQLGSPERLLAFCEETLAADPAHELAWYAKGCRQRAAGQVEAGESLRRFLMHVGRDTPPKLIAAAQRALWQDAHPGRMPATMEAEAAAKRAGQALMTGNFAAALPLFQEAVRLDETLANAWSNAGALLAMQGRFPEALSALTQACILDPRDQSSLKSRASVLMELKRFEDAAQGWERLTRWWPGEAEFWRQRGWCANILRRDEEALSCLGEALRLKPGEPGVTLELASVLDRQGKLEEALALARPALAAAPALRKDDGLAYLAGKSSSPAFSALLKG